MKKNAVAAICLAMMMIPVLPNVVLCANADGYYTEVNELSGIEFDSFKKLSDYVDSLNGISVIKGVETEVSDYLLTLDEIYVPVGISTDDINKILITPTYVELYFDYNGVKMQFSYYHNPDVGKGKLDEAKLMGNPVNGESIVYCYESPYFDDYESYYVWKQDNEYFQLRIGGKSNDEYAAMCNVTEHDVRQNSKSEGLQTVNGKLYFVNSDGTYAAGWKTIDGNKYYFRKNGEAVTKNTVIGKIRYKFGSDGVCKGKYSGWVRKSGKYYYYKNGEMKKNCWLHVNGKKTYYLTSDGSRAVGKIEISGKTYTFDEYGKLQ